MNNQVWVCEDFNDENTDKIYCLSKISKSMKVNYSKLNVYKFSSILFSSNEYPYLFLTCRDMNTSSDLHCSNSEVPI